MKKTLVNVRKILNLHSIDNRRRSIIIATIAIVILALAIRGSLIHAQNADYDIFSAWYNYVKAHGIGSFKEAFSNYNPPYTYFLYLVTLLPVSKIVAIKGLMVVFDALLAVSVYYVVKALRPKGNIPIIAGVGSLFLPTVLATGAYWGQFDQFYTAFVLFSLYAVLKDKSKLAWIFFGVAIAIKLQAIFFLPVLIIMSFKRIRLIDALYGIVAFLGLTFLPIISGRSIGSILNIYIDQTGLFKGNLTLNAPNIYSWVPNSAYTYLDHAGIYLTLAVMAAFLIYAIKKQKYSNNDIMLLSALLLFLVPFLLPQMHERYFFMATIASSLLLISHPRLSWVAITMQVTTIFSYMPFLFSQQPPVSFAVLALVGLVMVAAMLKEYVSPHKTTQDVLSE